MVLSRMGLGGGKAAGAKHNKRRESPCRLVGGGGNILSGRTTRNGTTTTTTKRTAATRNGNTTTTTNKRITPRNNNNTKRNSSKPSLRRMKRQPQNQSSRLKSHCKVIFLAVAAIIVTISLGIFNRTIEDQQQQSPKKLFNKNLPTPPPLTKITSEGALRKKDSTPNASQVKNKEVLPDGNHIIDEGKCRQAIKKATDYALPRTETKGDDMMSIERKQNMVELVTKAVLQPHLRGDFVEAGTYVGTSSLLAAIVQKAALDNPSTCGPAMRKSRTVWIADSFVLDGDGDEKEDLEAAAKKLFRKQGFQILDQDITTGGSNTVRPQVPIKLLKGYFDDTLPTAPIENIAVLRLYGDMHSTSTIQALNALYPKVSVGGFVIVDDYGFDGEQYKNTLNEYFASENLEWKHIDYGTGQGRWFQKTK